MITKKDIGLNIKMYRKKKGMLQREVAAVLKTRKEQISRIETGKGNYGIDWLFKIAGVLQCRVEDFCSDNKQSPNLGEVFKYLAEKYSENKNGPT